MRLFHHLKELSLAVKRSPKPTRAYGANIYPYLRGFGYASNFNESHQASRSGALPTRNLNPLLEYFHNHKTGPGIWKWEHYFEIYERHFSKFVGQPVDVMEIGIYSGGSLGMWRSYFGERSRIFGVDIEPACKVYEAPGINVHIGDQGSRDFWTSFKREVSGIDILIDDGSHAGEDQMVTLEEMLPHIRPGGVYLCEDVHGLHHGLVSFASGLISDLNAGRRGPSGFQKSLHSVHFYPFVLVLEKHSQPISEFQAPKYGTEWQPFSPTDKNHKAH
jgi:hypothetical protein